MQLNWFRRAGGMLFLVLLAARLRCASAANVMNYGADGNDYFQFSNPSMAFDKASGFTTLITFAMHVNADGTLLIAGVACSNGVYIGPTNWNSLITTLKTPPTTVNRYEVCIGGWQDSSYDNIKSLAASQGMGTNSILYKNFQALKHAVPGIDAINDDDEQTYDVISSQSFANMLGGLGYKFTLAPYTAQSFWVNLRSSITNCDYIYLQCYSGGAGNDPAQWNAAFGNGITVIPGQESNTAYETNFHNWHLETGVQGGFYYPDVVFNAAYWSSSVYEACGIVPPTPTGAAATPGGKQVILSWNMSPGATFYKVKRSTVSGGETTIATNPGIAFNSYTDTGLISGTTYYYKVSAFNTNGESLNAAEVSAMPQAGIINNTSFEFDFTAPGTSLNAVPSGWIAFNEVAPDRMGSQNAGFSSSGNNYDYSTNNPLAAPAAGNQFCWINLFSGDPTGGIYQDVGPLQSNTIYTLTVAIGSRKDRVNSPGIISLVNGTNNTGIVLAAGGGLPPTQNTWKDYSVTFTTGASVSGDLTIMLSAIGAGTVQADFDNVRLSFMPVPVTPPTTSVIVNNFSFEANVAGGGGQVVNSTPSSWTSFNSPLGVGSQWAGGSVGDFTVNTPMASPAAGNQYCWVNQTAAGVTAGIYQNVGVLLANTVYTLTVAIGSRNDRVNSPGIISLINGNNNLGTVLASGGGLPSIQNSWKDYSITYVTGNSVVGNLTIALSAVGAGTIQADFDNVRLTKAPLYATPPVLGAPMHSGGNLVLTGTGGTPGAGYTWLVATNLLPPINWMTNSTGILNSNGAFSNAMPVNPSQPASFFKLRLP